MKNSRPEIKLRTMDANKIEVSVNGRHGLLVREESGEWELSPNLNNHKESILKRIKEVNDAKLKAT